MLRLVRSALNGKMEWQIEDGEKYDFAREICVSNYGDMLHDRERNDKYEQAIARAVRRLLSTNCQVRCVDLGAGTGLLSMMAVRAGCHHVTAFESFQPMAHIAQRVLQDNRCSDRVTVVNKQSTDVTANEFPDKANLLVSEIFDTELLGEGMIPSFVHAHENLISSDAIVVPAAASIFVVPLQSQYLRKFHHIPGGDASCRGPASLFDLHFSRVKPELYRILSDPIEAFGFDFHDVTSLRAHDSRSVRFRATQSGRCDALLLFWRLYLDSDRSIVLDMAPCQINPGYTWREHWMQAIFYPCQPVEVTEGEESTLVAHHDEYNVWFDTQPAATTEDLRTDPPVCTCGLHLTWNRNRMQLMNRKSHWALFSRALSRLDPTNQRVALVGDGNPLTQVAVTLCSPPVTSFECNTFTLKNMFKHARRMGLSEVLQFTSEVETDEKFDIILGEPFFADTIFPWHHAISFHSLCNSLGSEHLNPLPQKAFLKCMVGYTSHLHRLRLPLGEVCGFDMTSFDEVISLASKLTNPGTHGSLHPESHYLAQYDTLPLSEPLLVHEFDFRRKEGLDESRSATLQMNITHSSKSPNAIFLWMDYELTEDIKYSEGAVDCDTVIGELAWNDCFKQAVLFIPDAVRDGSFKLQIVYSEREFKFSLA